MGNSADVVCTRFCLSRDQARIALAMVHVESLVYVNCMLPGTVTFMLCSIHTACSVWFTGARSISTLEASHYRNLAQTLIHVSGSSPASHIVHAVFAVWGILQEPDPIDLIPHTGAPLCHTRCIVRPVNTIYVV